MKKNVLIAMATVFITVGCGTSDKAPVNVINQEEVMRQFGIRLEQRELFSILNTIPLNSLRFVIEETIGSKCSDEVH